jgi:hypothetical protein
MSQLYRQGSFFIRIFGRFISGGINLSIKPLTEYFRFRADQTVLDVGECGLYVLRFKLDEMQPSPLGHGVHGVIRNLQTSIDFFPRKIPDATLVLLKLKKP